MDFSAAWERVIHTQQQPLPPRQHLGGVPASAKRKEACFFNQQLIITVIWIRRNLRVCVCVCETTKWSDLIFKHSPTSSWSELFLCALFVHQQHSPSLKYPHALWAWHSGRGNSDQAVVLEGIAPWWKWSGWQKPGLSSQSWQVQLLCRSVKKLRRNFCSVY